MSHKIDTYTNTSDDHTINKVLTAVSSQVDCLLKNDTELIRPELIMSGSTSQDFNYVYIEDFGRYYFVRNRTYSKQHYIVSLEVDVLMSFRSEIKDLECIAKRSSSTFNVFQRDPEVSILNRNIIATQKFSGFSGQSIILSVSGD